MYIAKGGKQGDAFMLALNALINYKNDDYGCKDAELIKRINQLAEKYASLSQRGFAGIKEVTIPPSFDETDIRSFFESRSSVRDYSDVPITVEQIKRALDFAALTPTACNRQSSRVYAFRDKTIQRQILDLQLGDQGWCFNADTLFVITGVEAYFCVYERSETYIDGGLFAMNFVYGLHLQHIASCFKMFVRTPRIMRDFRRVCGIPDNETPIVLVLAGHYQSRPTLSPKSHRFKVPALLDGKSIQ